MITPPGEQTKPPPDALRLGHPQNHDVGWRLDLFDGQDRLVTTLSFGHEEQARQAHAAMKTALNVTVESDGTKNDLPVRSDVHGLAGRSDSERGNLRQWTHMLLDEGQMETLPGQIIEGFLIFLIVANVVAVALETVPALHERFAPLFVAFEDFSLAVYTLEYAARIWSATEDPRIAARGRWHGRILYALRPLMIVDFLAIAPSLVGLFFGIDLRVLRIFRLFRLLKLARYSHALQALLSVLVAERSALFASAILLLASVCFYGELMHLAEGAAQPHTLGTMPGAMYWAITTLATVGYGDITPVTAFGRLIAGATMVTGLALFALPVGIIANGFVTGLNRRRFAITWSMLRRQPLFQGFDADTLATILEVPEALIIREHTQLTVAGRNASTFYLIVSGRACAETADAGGEIGPGETFGEESLSLSGTYGRTVTADTDMRLIAFQGEELRRLCRKFPWLKQRIEHGLDVSGGDQEAAGPAPK
ncbi:MAG TPA: cyclic nucleotide-gated ion channel [Rhizomicrobium sp.]|jgi:voltage-gated potassium channel|nr:cyclic nucleotide-gated ion channel [Rhizomicrobium sp.]